MNVVDSYILSPSLTHLPAADARYVPTPPLTESQVFNLLSGSPGSFWEEEEGRNVLRDSFSTNAIAPGHTEPDTD